MRARPMLTSILLIPFLLTGCAGAASSDPTSTAAAPTIRPLPDPAPTPLDSDTSADELVVTLDAIEYTHDGRTDVFTLDQAESLVALIEELTGQPPAREDIEDPRGNGDLFGTSFTWADVTVASFDGGPTSVTFLSPAVGDADVITAEGIKVGSTRAEVIAAGGWGEGDSDGDGVVDTVNLGMRAVPGTDSLSRPGEVGAEFIGLSLTGDEVDRMWTPSNDFTDL
ncbi:hypothetical protein [Microbacterium yannicii]|uniref:hypothetical protein n=1 Tax=Microbacterium yannicii TaxID=671622 RepID=UPI00036FF9D0|nr:hypothetical protein [Microbacterium yannicii]